MKLTKSVAIVLAIIGVGFLFFFRNLDKGLWEHVDNLIPICQEDQLIERVTNFRQFNGVTEINRKYKLLISYLEFDGEVFVIYEPEKIDSIVKYQGQDSLLIYFSQQDLPMNFKAVFDCQ